MRVNGIGPDLTQTPQVDYTTRAVGFEHLWPAWAPVGRMGWPEDQARVALFLASDMSAFVTGHNIPTDGGTKAGGGWFFSPESSALPQPPDQAVSGAPMDLAMTLPTMLPQTREQTLAWIRAVDEGPWSSLAVPERVTYTSHSLTVQLAAAAALTERVRLWSTIVILPAHDAVQVAKDMAIDRRLSGGRLTVGVGVGGREHDYRAIGASFERRWQRMDEQVDDDAAHLVRRAAVRGRRPGRAAAGAGGRTAAHRRRRPGPRRSPARPSGRPASTTRR